jgi:3-hydroxyacyl-CoA dehydrogenase
MSSPVSYTLKGRIGVIRIDNPPVNALGHAVRAGLVAALDQGLADKAAEALVLIAAGRTFPSGADVREFGKPPIAPILFEVIARFDGSSKPVVAAIHGTALGGGLELAMGCNYRVAVPNARLGLPEIKLGLIPGAGGTQRLPRLIGPEAALAMILSGDPIPAAKAKGNGLIDAVIEGDLEAGAIAFAESIAATRPLPRISDQADRLKNVDRALFTSKRAELAKTARHLVAPERAVAAVEMALDLPLAQGLKREREMFLALIETPQSKAARHLFFADREAARIPDIAADTPTRDIKSAAVLGAGTMGGGIAICFANAGIPVTVLETDQAALDRGLTNIRKNYDGLVERGRLKSEERDARLARVKGTLNFDDLASADAIVEAVFEDMKLKKDVFARLDKVAKPGALLATNTSTLDVDDIASVTKRPTDVLGLHFFSPAPVMKLLEVVRGKATAPGVMASGMKLGKTLGKTAVPVGVCFGFVGNRIMLRYALEGELLLEEGALPQDVDQVLRDFGLPMGLFGMVDLAGVDVFNFIRQHEMKTRPKDAERLPQILDKIAGLKRYGQKTGAGFYRYEGRAPSPDPVIEALIVDESKRLGIGRRKIDDDEILRRIVAAMVNEGARVLEEKIALRPSDIDVIFIHGFGFPPWRGGPMFHADLIGLAAILADIREYQSRFGARWTPSELLVQLVAEGRNFASLQGR